VPTAFRLAPPLVGSDEDMDRGLSLVLRCLDEVVG
jgi:4-aminobutyrate aminotransferase-like enzyme